MQSPLLDHSKPPSSSSDKPYPPCVYKYGFINQDPYNTNFISRLFFHWAYRIIKLASLTSIKNEYLGKLMGQYQSHNYLKDIVTVWEDKKYKYKKRIALILAGFRSNIDSVIYVVIFSFLRSGLKVIQMTLFREYMKMFGTASTALSPFIYGITFTHTQIGVMYLLVRLIEIFVLRKGYEYQAFLGHKSSVEFNCLIFAKLLRVSPSSTKDKARSGEIMNFLQVDANKLRFLMSSSPDLITMPILIVTYSYMLFQFFGVAFFYGLATMLLFFMLNFIFQRKFKVLQKKQTRLRDVRMKVTTETFDNLKVLKLYSWEDEFLNRIDHARDAEIENLKKRFEVSNINLSLLWFAPVATSVASIGVYQYYNDTLKVEDIFTCLGIFTSLQGPLRMIPVILNNFYETSISMARIQKYLGEDEIREGNIIRNDEITNKEGIAIKVENGCFSWGVPPSDKNKKEGESYKEMEKRVRKEKTQRNDINKQRNINNSQYGPVELSTSVSSNSSSSVNEDDIETVMSDKSRSNNSSKRISSKIDESISSGGLIPPSLNNNNNMNTLKNINLTVNKGEFICIIGEVGSGKSSLLQAILNNLIPTTQNYKLILNGSVSYVSQIPWIQNATVKDNILFYQPLDIERYNKVIELCELKPDLEVLVGGDLTEIGEKGINLSGGQKARISLARALYANKDIYIFDDPISALDAHVGMNIMNNCIISYLKGKTRILVTHALQYVSYADRIIYMKEGQIEWEGTYQDIKKQEFFNSFYERMKTLNRKNSKELEEDISQQQQHSNNKNKSSKGSNSNSSGLSNANNGVVKRITCDEDKEEGNVSLEVYKEYIQYIGGWLIIILFLILLSVMQGFKGASDIWLGYWSDHQSPEKNTKYFIIYSTLGLTGCVFNYLKVRLSAYSSIRTSSILHKKMIHSLIRAPISTFHETIPKGQIFNRLSKDINHIDIFCMRSFSNILDSFIALISAIFICSLYQPLCLILVPILTFIGAKIALFYVNCSREITRLEGILRSPMMNLLNEAIPGTITIRAFDYQKRYMEMFHDRIDEHLKIMLILNGITQWFDLWLDFVTFIFISFLVIFTIVFKDLFDSKIIGILLTYCISLQTNLVNGLHVLSTFENCMVSMERCLKYTKSPSEKPKDVVKVDEALKSWPHEGKVKFENYSVKYRPDTEIVLKDINFEINGGEKVGIVGRTGSGKSTISLCLFRLLEPLKGKIYIDDVDITTIGLTKLRSNLTIIPQDPSLMEGTLRYNIDPLHLYSDSDIISVLRKIDFEYIVNNRPEGLAQTIAEGGSNLSVGEKQLICIVRAILRKSKIIVMDEATASIDYQTEEIIQKAINELLKKSTILTIAHRIKTIINCDRIITLDNGSIVDFDTPKKLLENKQGLFYELYNKSTL